MPKATLLVRRKGTAMVPHYEAHPQVRRFHGWKFDPTLGEEFDHPEHKQRMRMGGFAGHDNDIEVPDTVEYRRHLKDGDLWPANQATAQAVGLPFDPTFGTPPDAPLAAIEAAEGVEMVAGPDGVAHGTLTVHEESPVKSLLPELTPGVVATEQHTAPAVEGH